MVNKFQQKSLIAVLLAVTFTFQSLSHGELVATPVPAVNEEVRLAHAKELLGKSFDRRHSRYIAGIQDISQLIWLKLKNSLPKEFKKSSKSIAKVLIEESMKRNLDPVFVMAVIETESSFNPKARGSFGEIGLMQIKPDTAAWIAGKFNLRFAGPTDLESPTRNIRLGVAYMAFLRDSFNGSAFKYLAAYNMGPGRLRRMVAAKIRPKEYAVRVMGNYQDLYSEISSVISASSTKSINVSELKSL